MIAGEYLISLDSFVRKANKVLSENDKYIYYLNGFEGVLYFESDETLKTNTELGLSEIKYDEKKNKATFIVSDITKKLINNMFNCLKEIEKKYPKNIQIN